MRKDSKIDVRVPCELKDKVQEEAKRQDRSKAYIIIKAIEAYLSGERP